MKFGRNLINYMFVQHNYLKLMSAIGFIYLPQICKFILKLCHWNVQTTSQNYQAWIMLRRTQGALSMMLKALPLVRFWSILLLKEQMMASVRKKLKTLVWSAQNWSISSEIYPENNHKIGHFLRTTFQQSLPWKFLWNSHEISQFFRELVFKNPAKFDLFSATYQKPCLSEMFMLHTIFLPFFYIYNSALLSGQPKL